MEERFFRWNVTTYVRIRLEDYKDLPQNHLVRRGRTIYGHATLGLSHCGGPPLGSDWEMRLVERRNENGSLATGTEVPVSEWEQNKLSEQGYIANPAPACLSFR